MSPLTGQREVETEKKRRLADLHKDQLDALDAALALMSGANLSIGDLETLPGAEAAVLYSIEDNNPYASRLFGDAKTTIEEMIVATARKYSGHPALARAGLGTRWLMVMNVTRQGLGRTGLQDRASDTLPGKLRGNCRTGHARAGERL